MPGGLSLKNPILWLAITALVLAGVPPVSAKQAGARRLALLVGGSGEPEVENFFVRDLRDYRARLSARGWKVRAVVGSRDRLLPSSLKATNAHIDTALREVLAAAQKDDQVLLLFHAHGRERESYWGQQSHSVTSEDRDPGGTEPGFDLDALEPALTGAKSRGVRVALVDLSCYSGETQRLKGPSCTVTLAASRYISLCSGRPEERLFGARFFNLPEAGVPVDLESQYLMARRADPDSTNLPQISSRTTPALAGWNSFLLGVDPLDTFGDLKDLHAGTPPFPPESLTKEVGQGAALNQDIAARLKEVLTARARLESAMTELARDYDVRRVTVALPGRESLTLSPGDLADLLDVRGVQGYTQAQRNLRQALLPVRGVIEREHSAPLGAYRARRAAFDGLTHDLERFAGQLFADERKLYDALSVPSGSEKSACRDFRL